MPHHTAPQPAPPPSLIYYEYREREYEAAGVILNGITLMHSSDINLVRSDDYLAISCRTLAERLGEALDVEPVITELSKADGIPPSWHFHHVEAIAIQKAASTRKER